MFTPILKQLLTPVVRNIFDTYGSKMFSPVDLFTTGINGVWYDPSDLTTLYQDAAGTLPVTAVEQPVGLMLDKSKGLVLGPELVANGGFAGVANGTDVTTLPGWAAYGTPTNRDIQSEQLRITTSAGGQGVKLTLSTSAGKRYLLKAAAAGDLGSAGMYSDYTGDISTVGGKVGISFVATGSSSTIYFRAANNSIGTTYYDNISVRELPGNHAFNPSGNSANFPVLQQDGTGRYYLAFNGTNQWLQTNSIDFTYGDKMFVCAGVRKLNDAASGIAVELSASVSLNNGSFLLYAPFAAGDYRFSSKGTLQATRTLSPYSAPITNVFSGIADVAGKSLLCRINGAPAGITGAADQGTGNYGNYPLYIGARAGSSLWFNGRMYGLVVTGKQTSAAEITSAETYINNKTGAYL